jgi:hypothetical protein
MPLHGKGDPGKRRSNNNPCQPSSSLAPGDVEVQLRAAQAHRTPLHADTGVLTAGFYRPHTLQESYLLPDMQTSHTAQDGVRRDFKHVAQW